MKQTNDSEITNEKNTMSEEHRDIYGTPVSEISAVNISDEEVAERAQQSANAASARLKDRDHELNAFVGNVSGKGQVAVNQMQSDYSDLDLEHTATDAKKNVIQEQKTNRAAPPPSKQPPPKTPDLKAEINRQIPNGGVSEDLRKKLAKGPDPKELSALAQVLKKNGVEADPKDKPTADLATKTVPGQTPAHLIPEKKEPNLPDRR